jgi:hypothetical protein
VFVGHLGVALASKRLEPRLSLAALTLAAFGVDILWPVFLLTGIEVVRIRPGDTAFTPLEFVSYPWSHSLAMTVLWGALAAAVTVAFLKSTRAALVLGALVVSHWVLDWITHRPDLPLWPGGPVQGLGLWQSIGGTLAVEAAVLALGIALYQRETRVIDGRGRWPFVALVALVTAIWLSSPFSPPPPSVMAIAAVGLLFPLIMTPWTIWIERRTR